MQNLEELGLIYDWNKKIRNGTKQILDTSLRDGLQDPSIKQPKLEEKIHLIDLMANVGIDAADIGFPVSSKEHKYEVTEIAKHIKKNRLGIKICCLARTQIPDIEAAIEVSQKAQAPLEVITIVGSSKVRHFVESWDLEKIKKWVKESIQLAVKNNLEVNFLTEDGTRTEPEVIKELYSHAVEQGATKVTIADTVGFITPYGAARMIRFLKDEVINDPNIMIDWHGHNDRDFGTSSAITALEEGAHRAHVCILGIGERAGNTALEPLLLNMEIMGMTSKKNLRNLPELSRYASEVFGFPIAPNLPGVGEYVHTTSVGIHASAIVKARDMYREDLANTVYSGVDAQMFGLKTEVFVGPLSGKANVKYVLKKHGMNPSENTVRKILNHAVSKNAVLKDDEVVQLALKAEAKEKSELKTQEEKPTEIRTEKIHRKRGRPRKIARTV